MGQRLVSANTNHITIQDSIKSKLHKNSSSIIVRKTAQLFTNSKASNGQRLVSSDTNHLTIQDSIKSKLDKNTRKSSNGQYSYLFISFSFHPKLSTKQPHVVSLPSVHIVYQLIGQF
jgi:hypothetical protein